MTPFDMLSALTRAAFALWALLICLAFIFLAALAAVRKRTLFAVFAVALFSPVYFMWQVIFDVSLSKKTGDAVAVSRTLGAFPWAVWLAFFGTFTAGAALLFALNFRYYKNRITPAAIKSFLDGIPCGVCCFLDNGKVIFSNVCMNDLCVRLTGGMPLDGNMLRDAVSDGIVAVGDKVWRFACRGIESGGGTIHELIASDITAEYAKTRALETDRAELFELNSKLREYYLSIDDAVRRRETLQAKINIHDEMNRLMLSTSAADREDAAELDRIFSLWEQNALLLCMEAHGGDVGVEALARALKIDLVWQDAVPEALTEEERDLVFTAAKEAAINAVKHAGAKALTVSFDETDSRITANFSSGGDVPAGEIRFTGGLANLERLANKHGATVTASAGDRFTLSLTFFQNNPNG